MAKIDEGNLSLFYGYEIRNKNGKVIRKVKKRRGHSFVIAFLRLLQHGIGDGYYTATNYYVSTAGTTVYTTYNGSACWAAGDIYSIVTAPATNLNYGIVFGTGTNAVSINDYNLQTKITDGDSSGKLQHGATTVSNPTVSGSDMLMTITRDVSNNSGGSITITEVGLIGYFNCYSGVTPYALLARDIVSITLANGEQLTFNYILQTTV